jgi:hypothetical protein
VLALGRYGIRQPAIALRTNSPSRLHDALLATAICQSRRENDPWDVMVGMALHHHVARQLDQDPVAVFAQVARCLPDGPIRDLLRTFGARNDTHSDRVRMAANRYGRRARLRPDAQRVTC